MARRKLSTDDLAQIEELAKQWGKIIVAETFGEEGPGLDVDLAMMEEAAVAAARGLTAGTLEEATRRQGERFGATQACPDCGTDCDIRYASRPITVRGGRFEHEEPVAHCPRCRRDFFPSASRVEA